jgi:hypothetical protein
MTASLSTPQGWMPIETAPKDGTLILVARRRLNREHVLQPPEVVIAAWLAPWGPGSEEWVGVSPRSLNGDGSCVSLCIGGDFAKVFPDVGPTHWQPLPAPPVSA